MGTTPTHTPGPWHINGGPNPTKPNYATIYVKPGDHTTVDHICSIGERYSQNWQANARLIRSAPDLLSALNGLLIQDENLLDQRVTHEGLTNCDVIAKARQAINTAEGRGEP